MSRPVLSAVNPVLDRDAAQAYIRANPGVALDYCAALLRDNAAGLCDNDGQVSAELAAERRQRDRRLFQANLDACQPLVGHVLACSEPLMTSLLEGSGNYLFVSRRPGAWAGPKGDADADRALDAETDLSSRMGAPVLIALQHKDEKPADAHQDYACGCAAVTAAAKEIHAWARGNGVNAPHVSQDLTVRVHNMAMTAYGPAIALAAARGIRADDARGFTRCVPEAVLEDTMTRLRRHESGRPAPRRVIGAIVDQRSGALLVRDADTGAYKAHQPRQSLIEIERRLIALAEGGQPRRNALPAGSILKKRALG